ncbi:MAG: cytochrome ubiquinol oxidase subunit I, partial [Sulfobacillus sp.]|nr:cytochrome ubiquinol oxidase subunit I [Sulfobacillus sp.]
MTLVGLDRLQFGVTIVYHFLFVPITIGLSLMIAILETLYWRDPKPADRLVID